MNPRPCAGRARFSGRALALNRPVQDERKTQAGWKAVRPATLGQAHQATARACIDPRRGFFRRVLAIGSPTAPQCR